MVRLFSGVLAQARYIVGALALTFVLAVATPALAQQQTPLANNPTASAVQEDQLLRQLRVIDGRVSIPDQQSRNLQQPGRDWREFHQTTLRWISAIVILGALAAIVVFYLSRGMVKIENGRSGRTVVRFNALERFVHWMTATCFIILALSGLNITFGKSLLAPVIGLDAFAAWSQLLKYAHNYLSFPFTLGVVLILLLWISGNIPGKADVEWVKSGGGLFGKDHPPAPRFNAGQKLIYWVVILGGLASAITGYILMFPFYATDVAGMQTAQSIHGIVAALFIAIMLGHIYIGSIGMEGAFEAMGEGTVDENWAKQHHSLWLEEEKRRGAPTGATPHGAPAE